MRIGFTGTQVGLSDYQRAKLSKLLHNAEFHHGDCIGADAEAHLIAVQNGMRIVIHPPLNESKRAFCDSAEETRPAKDYLSRNHDIVDECDVIIACPKERTEQVRSGTWATVRYARKQNKTLTVIYPDGDII